MQQAYDKYSHAMTLLNKKLNEKLHAGDPSSVNTNCGLQCL